MSILRKAKLKLTVDLMNNQEDNAVNVAKESMSGIKGIGRFLGLTVKRKDKLDPTRERKSYAMRFENATLNLNTISNPLNHTQAVSSFSLQ